jgi:hypothetical protein
MIVPLSDLENALNEIQTNSGLIKVFVSPEAKERVILYTASLTGDLDYYEKNACNVPFVRHHDKGADRNP